MSAAKYIEENKDHIIKIWREKLLKEVPLLQGHSKYAIENSIPGFLDAIIKSIYDNNPTCFTSESKEHGKQRLNFENYSLTHVIKEYHLLKRVIFDLMDNDLKVEPVERNVIMNSIDQAIEQAGEVFHRLKTQNIIEEKEKAEAEVENLQKMGDSREFFFSSISHDLKNPINNIKLLVQILKKDPQAIGDDKIVKVIQSSVEKAETLINDLLDVNLISTGKELPIEVKECHLIKQLKEILSNYQFHEQDVIQLKTYLEDPIIYVDCKNIMRAVTNLLDNAFKYGDTTQPITVECKKRSGQIIISVHNYGNPIPLENQADIFNRYFRINQNKTESWGIGLSLVKGIAEAHGGKVSVDSTEEEGTKFTINIPARKKK